MSHLQPVPSDYLPAYPRELTTEQIQELLHPGLLKRFSQRTLATGALVAGMAASGCSESGGPPVTIGEAAADDKPVNGKPVAPGPDAGRRRKGPTTSTDPNLKKKVDTIVAEVLGKSKKGYWYEHSYLGPAKELKANPPVKYPVIPISYGNSCVGIFDHEVALEATHRLFESFGIKLKKNIDVRGAGYQFTADGFNADESIGFELIMPQGRAGFSRRKFEKQEDAAYLSKEEKAELSQDVHSGQVDVLVIDASKFHNMDGDLYTPMEYYLGSVVDYLNWVHGDTQIDPMTVLGKLPGRTGVLKKHVEEWQAKYATIPGGGFEDADDVENWTGKGVKLSQSQVFSGNLARGPMTPSSIGTHSLQLEFDTGGTARYTVPDGESVLLPDGEVQFVCRAYNTYPKEAPLKIVLTGKDGGTWEIKQPIAALMDVRIQRLQAPFKELASIELSMAGDATYMIWLDDIGFTRVAD